MKSIRGLSCPFCGGTVLRGPLQKFTTPAMLVLLVGLLFLPFFGLGLIFVIIALRMREVKYRCENCRKRF